MVRVRQTMVVLLAVMAMAIGAMVASPTHAGAATIRQGARWDHMDIVMSRQETSDVARGVVGGAKICWPMAAASTALGAQIGGPWGAALGAVASSAMCITAVTVCAAKAHLRGRSAGMTISPAWHGLRYWCWDY